jgi:predicted XRE-type DNA-binding protein
MEKLKQHWTESSTKDFVFKIASDFVFQIEKKLEREDMNQAQLAALLHVTDGSVSQVFNNPGNFKLTRIVEYARALGMKVAIVAYEDNDPSNNKGPVNSEIFHQCWKRAGSPEDFFSLDMSTPRIGQLTTSEEAVNQDYRRENVDLERTAGTRHMALVR